MGYTEPGIKIDTDEPIRNGERGRVWKAGGGKSGFKASYESVFVDYDPDKPDGEQFDVGYVTPAGAGEVGTYGTRDAAVEAAREQGRKFGFAL